MRWVVVRYCLNCGREVPDEDYVNGYCIDCFRKIGNPFTKQVSLELKVCSRCGSIFYKGEWHQDSMENVVRRYLLDNQAKYMIASAELISVEPSGEPRESAKGVYVQNWLFGIVLNKRHFAQFNQDVRIAVSRTICPRCLARASRKISAVVQVRGVNAQAHRGLVEEVIRSNPGYSEYLVDVEDAPNGFDIRFVDQLPARRLAYELARLLGGHVKETFKSTRYDSRKGVWQGIHTFSVRLPDITEGSIVKYGGELWVVKKLDVRGVQLEAVSSARRTTVPLSEYWSGRLLVVENYYVKGVYEVVAVDKSMVYLLNRDSGEVKEFLLSNIPFQVKQGDYVKILVIDDKEYVLKYGQ